MVKVFIFETQNRILGLYISPRSTKSKAVKKFPIPKDVRYVQVFLGLTGYFRQIVQGYAHIAEPLINLLKKDTPFQMTITELAAIAKL